MTDPRVTIVVLNHNGWADTVECLESLSRVDYKNCSIVVVDNGSSDGSAEKIRAWARNASWGAGRRAEDVHEIPIRLLEYDGRTREVCDISNNRETAAAGAGGQYPLVLIHAGENLGFAVGNNIGIGYALSNSDSDYVLVMNNDTVVETGFLSILLRAFSRYPLAGIVGPKILDYKDGSDWQWPVAERLDFWGIVVIFSMLNRFFRKTNIYRKLFYIRNEESEVYAVPGSCMLFSRRALELTRGFDENTFLYWEEFIMAEKLRAVGLKTYIIPTSRIYHKLGRSTVKIGARRFIENMKSEQYYLSRYQKLSSMQFFILKLLRLVGYSARLLWDRDYRRCLREFLAVLAAGLHAEAGRRGE